MQWGNTMTKRQKTKVSKTQLIRAVASSSAIETGESTQTIAAKLKSETGKFKHLTLTA